MPDLAFDLRHLKYAMLVAEHGSFRRAADATNIPQSTITRRIQLLEAQLGVALFERSKTGARPTYSGERFIREATFGAEHLSRAVTDLRQVRSAHSGVLRVGIVGSLASGFLADLLNRFHRKHENIDVVVEESSSQSIAAGVSQSRLDVAFVCGSPQLAGCQIRPLWRERILLAVPAAHTFAASVSVNLEDVRDEVFIVRAHGPGPEIEDYLVRQLSGPSFRPRIVAHNVGAENLLNMVARGFGVTLSSESALGTSYSGVRFIGLSNEQEVVGFSILWRTTNENPAMRALLQLSAEGSPGFELQSSD
ncbi:LysR family transcriptional regulator [Sphingomonas sp. LH128]|uniref:LysR family transcriptional regulator n=1 Tax=Sphingomonas sp. LH128 TaxID=473781 RepID=UPI00027CB83B|nr:LysR family transcriptional regulator [Sphingomonas sp. LH128]EJU15037.1 LysR family transcriptional regulator [Sphingomonas sp. LH128]